MSFINLTGPCDLECTNQVPGHPGDYVVGSTYSADPHNYGHGPKVFIRSESGSGRSFDMSEARKYFKKVDALPV
ncbi:hypothetical protein KKF61_05235 [Patescibacteria group bacterium]|nr:hypothetical protein [Patescibacteria group bacterium]MBU0963709.1 hypothetical protein [Patescibacteria group bacterium]